MRVARAPRGAAPNHFASAALLHHRLALVPLLMLLQIDGRCPSVHSAFSICLTCACVNAGFRCAHTFICAVLRFSNQLVSLLSHHAAHFVLLRPCFDSRIDFPEDLIFVDFDVDRLLRIGCCVFVILSLCITTGSRFVRSTFWERFPDA